MRSHNELVSEQNTGAYKYIIKASGIKREKCVTATWDFGQAAGHSVHVWAGQARVLDSSKNNLFHTSAFSFLSALCSLHLHPTIDWIIR